MVVGSSGWWWISCKTVRQFEINLVDFQYFQNCNVVVLSLIFLQNKFIPTGGSPIICRVNCLHIQTYLAVKKQMLDHIFLFVLYTILHWVHSEFLQYMYMKKGSIHTVTAGASYQEYHVPLVMLKKSHKQSIRHIKHLALQTIRKHYTNRMSPWLSTGSYRRHTHRHKYMYAFNSCDITSNSWYCHSLPPSGKNNKIFGF